VSLEVGDVVETVVSRRGNPRRRGSARADRIGERRGRRHLSLGNKVPQLF
jgi:hypothetical protein